MIVMGTVDTAAPLTVRLDSGDAALPAKALSSHSPVQGERVFVEPGPPVVVLGSTAAGDTGWVNATLATGWTVLAGETPGYRRLHGVTYLRGRGASTGATAVAFVLPVGFRPSMRKVVAYLAVSAAYGVKVGIGGDVGQHVVTAVAEYEFGSIPPFPAEA